MKKEFIIRATFLVLMIFLVNYYVGIHVVKFLFQWVPPQLEPLYWLVQSILAVLFMLGRILKTRTPHYFGGLFQVIGAYYIAVTVYLFMFLLINDLVFFLMKLFGYQGVNFVTKSGIIGILFLITIMIFGVLNTWLPVVRSYHVVVEKKIDTLKELKVVAVSDLHLGHAHGNRHLRRMVKNINEQKPDIVVLVGDVLDYSVVPFIRNKMGDELKQLEATLGIYAVLGNHEYYGKDVETYIDEMKKIGIPVLCDEVFELTGGIYLVGRKDFECAVYDGSKRKPIKELLKNLDHKKPIIVLNHQPKELENELAAGVDVVFCGHTHRGQLAPANLATKRMYEIDWGYLKKERMHVFVSSGYGTWGPPIRIGSRCEIVTVTFKFSN